MSYANPNPLMKRLASAHTQELHSVLTGDDFKPEHLMIIIRHFKGTSDGWIMEFHLSKVEPYVLETYPEFEDAYDWVLLDGEQAEALGVDDDPSFVSAALFQTVARSNKHLALLLLMRPDLTRQELARYDENKKLAKSWNWN